MPNDVPQQATFRTTRVGLGLSMRSSPGRSSGDGLVLRAVVPSRQGHRSELCFRAAGWRRGVSFGLWAGLAWRFEARRVLTCLAGLAFGSVWLWALILTTTQTWHRGRIRWFAAQLCATVVVTTFLAIAALCRRHFELARHPLVSPPRPPKPFQFSLRQLMLLVFAACVTLGVGRARNGLFPPTGDDHVVAVRASLFLWLASTVAVVGSFVPKRLGI